MFGDEIRPKGRKEKKKQNKIGLMRRECARRWWKSKRANWDIAIGLSLGHVHGPKSWAHITALPRAGKNPTSWPSAGLQE